MGLILGDASFWKLKAAGMEQFEKDQQITEAGQKIIPTMSTEPKEGKEEIERNACLYCVLLKQ